MHIVWISFGYNPQIFFSLFAQVELIHFTTKVKGVKVFCGCNSSNSYMSIPLKLYRVLCHGLKVRISFGYNTQIIFVTYVHKFNFIILRPK